MDTLEQDKLMLNGDDVTMIIAGGKKLHMRDT